MDREAHRRRLIKDNHGITALMKLLGQISIIDRRMRGHMSAIEQGVYSNDEWDEMILDAETFYTVALETLNLAGQFFNESERGALKSDGTYKTIGRIRSERARHAYDKPDGDTYPGFGYSADYGPVLKAGSGRGDSLAYGQHFDLFSAILVAHKILLPGSFPKQPAVTDTMQRRFTGRDPVI